MWRVDVRPFLIVMARYSGQRHRSSGGARRGAECAPDVGQIAFADRVQRLTRTQTQGDRGLHRFVDRASSVPGEIGDDVLGGAAKTETHRQ